MARRRGTTVTQIHASWWEPHEVVLIRERITHGDQKKIYANIMQARTSADMKSLDMSFQVNEIQGALLKTMIQEWTLTDEAGKRLKLCSEEIDNLASEDVEWIAEQITSRNPVMTEAERTDFLTPAATSLSESNEPILLPS